MMLLYRDGAAACVYTTLPLTGASGIIYTPQSLNASPALWYASLQQPRMICSCLSSSILPASFSCQSLARILPRISA